MIDPDEGCPYCGAALAAKDIDGSAYYRCGSVGEKRTDQCKVHGKAWSDLNERILLLKEIGSGLCELVDAQTPTKNCSCHISPPCNDCIDNGHTRELIEHWNRLNP